MSKYKTLAEASIATKTLGILSQGQYKKEYKKDPQLVCNPDREYKSKWTGWKVFFGTRKNRYLTLDEASNASVKLGIKTSSEYNRKYKTNKRLVSAPYNVYATDWVSWADFLDKDSLRRYLNLCEASDSVAKLGISSQTQYYKRYKEDNRLPSNPRDCFSNEWTNWYDFLQKEKYPYYDNIQQASAAAIKLGIKSSKEYVKKYKNDPELNSTPNTHYSNWTCWNDFLNTHVERYKTLKEASIATQKLKIKSVKQYKKEYKRDRLLPSAPDLYYKNEWESFIKFLGIIPKYSTFIEASNNVGKLKIRSPTEYTKRCKEDPRLYSQPIAMYGDSWTSWDEYLQVPTKKLVNEKWKDVIEKYLDSEHNIGSKRAVLHKFYLFYYDDKKPTKYPPQILNINVIFDVQRYENFIFDQTRLNQKPYHRMINRFFIWLLESYCTDSDGIETVVLPGFRNPLSTIMRDFEITLPDRKRLQESNKAILPLNIVDNARNYLIPPNFKGFSFAPHLQEIFSIDWIDISKNKLDFDDSDCVWRKKPNSDDIWQIWSPVRAVALYMLLKVPLRGQQILWLDSGENDAELPFQLNGTSIEWKDNVIQFAGVKREKKGFITKKGTNSLGMYINTNKSSTSDGGYHVPYLQHDLALVLIRLRNWQSKFNPLGKLTKWTEINLTNERNKNLLNARGFQAFLFRNPLSKIGGPFRTAQVFANHLPIVLDKIQGPGEKLAWKEGAKVKSWYTPHSLRTSLITAYVVDGGIPIEIMSKLVGHSSIVMTIYYTKIESRKIRKELDKAEKIALAKSTDRIYDTILNDSIENAKGELFSKDKSFLDSIEESWPKSSYQVTDKGICAMGGGACDKGGVNEYGKPSYDAVPVGYLGKRNCIRCRYFITGPAFLGGLVSLCNEVILETNVIASELSISDKLRSNLKDEKYDFEISGKVFLQSMELYRSDADCEEKTMKLDVLLSDFAAIQSLMNECRSMLKIKENSTSKQLVASQSLFEIDFVLEGQESDFRLLNEICENAVLYSSASASRAIPLRSQALDKLAVINGLPPVMFQFTKEEQLLIGNQAAELIKSYVASWDDVDQLLNGQLKMDRYSKDDINETLSSKFQNLLKSAERKLLSERLE